jgi:predicted nucleic acid-binding protein
VSEGRVLLDTGPLVALFAKTDAHHRRCVETFATLAAPVFTCWPVLTEAAWILRDQERPGDRIADAHAAGIFELLPLESGTLAQIAAMMRRYESTGLRMADAALTFLADRENIRTIFTLDRRDFSIHRLKRNRSLKIIPDVR